MITKEIIVQCCVCHKIRDKKGKWSKEPIEYAPDTMHISHGYCVEHYNEAMATVKRMKDIRT